ncbi:oxygenase MpaB family protein [Gramella sp. MAR_2010_147]|uniref:oxygenase MpaB family protein n=1 Tax=Gramella sp. MAR_2010_147 TaxID=1250205 RepID=UPI000879552C|nr:oxygenase MpaB family protein [Gramella sp. MAR_2010_147]SDS66568.1 hypothetical protein SAMN04488553_2798 [Gramella sp. MAR_2010_147]
MEYFVKKQSIVREVWGKSDTILLIFAGAAAEFALNRAVDWLYFTGKLPKDPLGRLFSTVGYARQIVFSEKEFALQTIDKINAAHARVEYKREAKIPDWAYRNVLFMLIDYSIRSYEILERPLTFSEKKEIYQVFRELGIHMKISNLPASYELFKKMRSIELKQHLFNGAYTKDLYHQYRKKLGASRFQLLLETQILIVPRPVRKMLGLRKFSFLSPFIGLYKLSRSLQLDQLLKSFILPSEYKAEIKSLDHVAL